MVLANDCEQPNAVSAWPGMPAARMSSSATSVCASMTMQTKHMQRAARRWLPTEPQHGPMAASRFGEEFEKKGSRTLVTILKYSKSSSINGENKSSRLKLKTGFKC